MVGFFVGLFLGAFLGVLIIGLCQMLAEKHKKKLCWQEITRTMNVVMESNDRKLKLNIILLMLFELSAGALQNETQLDRMKRSLNLEIENCGGWDH